MKEYSILLEETPLTEKMIEGVLDRIIEQIDDVEKILLVPPDITRCYSGGGQITAYLYWKLSKRTEVFIMPAVGTHRAMTRDEQKNFFDPAIPEEAFLYHDWKSDTVKLGTIPETFCESVSNGKYVKEISVETDRRLLDKSFDLILSIGQVVPHEVVGMANYTKNILVGLGGRGMINESHMMGAVCNLETIMGEINTPVRKVFDYAEEEFLSQIPIVYILTVACEEHGNSAIYGIFTGDSRRVFEQAAALATKKNITFVSKPVKKVVAWLEPKEFTSFWVGNKAIYRTRMIIEDGGELLIIAPGVKTFGENSEVDALIRKYGYNGTPYTMDLVRQGIFKGMEMVAAHMIHSSSEGRFTITYAVNPQNMTKEEIESVGWSFMDASEALLKYPLDQMKEGYNKMKDGEEVYMVKAPALGVWKILPS